MTIMMKNDDDSSSMKIIHSLLDGAARPLAKQLIYNTTICQTIEIGRISKDLKGFERILLDFNGIVRHVDRFFGT